MDKFIEEVNKLSVNVKSSEKNKEIPDENSPAIDSLFSYAKAGVNALKSNGLNYINLHRLPGDLIPLFFHFESSGAGFVISGSGKYIFFMESSEKKIFIYGMANNKRSVGQGRGKMLQLFNIDFIENGDSVVFYDSTKKELSPEEIVLLTLQWSLN